MCVCVCALNFIAVTFDWTMEYQVTVVANVAQGKGNKYTPWKCTTKRASSLLRVVRHCACCLMLFQEAGTTDNCIVSASFKGEFCFRVIPHNPGHREVSLQQLLLDDTSKDLLVKERGPPTAQHIRAPFGLIK